MERGIGKVTTAGASLMCSLCGSQWEDHHPFTDEEFASMEGCIQAIGRRIAELDVRTAHIDGIDR
jgi:hypothetical protein